MGGGGDKNGLWLVQILSKSMGHDLDGQLWIKMGQSESRMQEECLWLVESDVPWWTGVWTNQRRESRFWEWDWLEGSIKKGVKQSSVKTWWKCYKKKMETSEERQQSVKWKREALQMLQMNEKEADKAIASITSVEEMMTKLLTLAYDQIQDEEMVNILNQLENYRKLLSECILEGAPDSTPLNMKRLKQSLKAGFNAFKRCKAVMSKEEKKKAVWAAFMCWNNWDYTFAVVVDWTAVRTKLKKNFKNVKRFGGRVVKTLRCGRRIPGSNPDRCMIFFWKK